MDRSRRFSKLLTFTPVLAALILSACGGGGGGAQSSPPPPPPVSRGFTVSASAFNIAASVAGDEPLFVTETVTVTDQVAGQFGIRGTYTRNGITHASRTTLSTTVTEISVGFISPHQVAAGVYVDTLTIGLCGDAACSIFTGNPLEIPITYTVTTGTMPVVTLASATAEISRLPWDIFTPPVASVVVTATPHTRYFLSVATTHTSDAVTSTTYVQDVADVGRVDIGFKPASQLTPGVHTDTVTVAACIDQACAYPLVVTPSVITVTYTVSPTLPGPLGYTVQRSDLAAADIAWSEAGHFLYASVPTRSPNYASRVVQFDPATETIGGTIAVGFDPSLLALSDDESKLYVAERGGDAIRRFSTAPLAADISIALGNDPYPPGTQELFAVDMRVAPGQPHVLAVRRNVDLSGRNGLGIVIYDDAAMRPAVAQISPFSDWGDIAWHPDGTRIYTNGAVLTVGPTGPVFLENLQSSGGHLRYSNGKIYSDRNQIIDPTAPQTYVSFPAVGQGWAMTLDVPANRAFLATQAFTNEEPRIEVFNLTTRAVIGTASLPLFGTNVRPTRIVRFGVDGVAVVTSDSQLFLVRGPLITAP